MPPPIYVERVIRASLEDVWRHTQDPVLHERWDLRFTTIDYLPRASDADPQHFRYETRIGFGLRIAGTGESRGEHRSAAERTSALRFWSDDARSLIAEGSGYWKYLDSADGVRFITRYDYRARHGRVGALVDRVIFRPLLGWATAWSFDRLRLWLERDVDPALSAHRALVHGTCRTALAVIWLYQGLVPKVLLRHPDEIEPIRATGLFPGRETRLVVVAGVAEMAFGVLLLARWRSRALYGVCAAALVGLGAGAAATTPRLYRRPFNPFTLTVGMLALCVLGWTAARDLPSARNCLRRARTDVP
jgi:hypothetical protein